MRLGTRSHPLTLYDHEFRTRLCSCLEFSGLRHQLLGGRGPAHQSPGPPHPGSPWTSGVGDSSGPNL